MSTGILATHHARRDDLDALLALYRQLNPDDVPVSRERLAGILDTAEAWGRGCYEALLQTGSHDPRVHRF